MSESENNKDGYNKGGFLAFVATMTIACVFFVVISIVGGIDLKEMKAKPVDGAPAAAEEVKVDVTTIQDFWMPQDAMVAHGKKLFAQNCAMCHGAEGKGDGIAGQSLNPRPRNLVEGKWKKGGGRLGLLDVLQNGIPGGSMTSYKHLPKSDRWALIHFINSITENKVADKDADVEKKAKQIN